jgi:DNA methylase
MRHRFHSMCPYFAMFPESFAEYWIKRLTRPGDLVLDPFCGRGTTALTALLCGRMSLSCDVNDVAFCLTQAKTNPPSLKTVKRRINDLENGYRAAKWKQQAERTSDFFRIAYSASTLAQLLYLRDVLRWKKFRSDCMIAGLVLGSLHGESQSSSYLSNQMPRTISTKPAYSVRFWQKHNLHAPDRDVFELLRDRADYRYASPVPDGISTVLHGDMRRLPQYVAEWDAPVRCVITSPPYLDVTNFEEDQWPRLWFLGGPPYPVSGRLSRDDRHSTQEDYWAFIADMWRCFGALLPVGGHVVIRIGTRFMTPEAVKKCLLAASRFTRRSVRLTSSRISEIKKRQTDAFRPGSKGCSVEVDCHFVFET